MNYTFSKKISGLAPSVIREILKFTSDPNVISFAAGNPAPETFPVTDITDITKKIMQENSVTALQYSITEGYMPLREYMKKYMNEKHDSYKEQDELIITSGAQQVMDLAAKSLCNENDTIICEAPTFIGSLNAFRSYNINLCGIPMQNDGMDMDVLENALKTQRNIRFIYTIPNFQNPSGITTSEQKRKNLYLLAKKYNVLILEDNPYGESRFDGENIPTVKSLDTDGLVIYAGSFSKVLSPGLRVGYAIAPKDIIAKMTVCKQTSDVHSSILSQMIAYEFIHSYNFESHLQKIRDVNGRKANLMMDLMDKCFKEKVEFARIQGGLFIWCTLPESVDMLAFCKNAVENKVALVPGNAFLINEKERCHNFRANFTTPTDEQLIQGMNILNELVKEI